MLANGDRLDGSFVAGEPHGPGTYTLPDGSVYEGQFEHSKGEGTVILTRPDGTQEEQAWHAGKRVDQAMPTEKKS